MENFDKGGTCLSNEKEYLKRSNKSRRRRTKEKGVDSFVNRLLNILIVAVSILIIISVTLILTNNDLKNNVKKQNEQSATNIIEDSEQPNNNSSGVVQQEDDEAGQSNEQQEDNHNTEEQSDESGVNNGQDEEGEENDSDSGAGSIEDDLQYITTIASDDRNVIVAFVDSRWTPYPTAQTGAHINAFNANHIDYKEKLQLLYRDTGFTENTSILWSIRNKTGDAVAVISAKDKTNIFRVTMKWIDGQGWQTILVEQLHSLDGAY